MAAAGHCGRPVRRPDKSSRREANRDKKPSTKARLRTTCCVPGETKYRCHLQFPPAIEFPSRFPQELMPWMNSKENRVAPGPVLVLDHAKFRLALGWRSSGVAT